MKFEDFQLTRHKHEVKIDSVQFGVSRPITLGLLFDVSGSRAEDDKLQQELDATTEFLRGVWQDGDVAFVATFDRAPRIQMPPSKDLDTILNAVNSFGKLKFRGMTALYDSICSIDFSESPLLPSHKVLLVFSDFQENSSRLHLQDAVRCALKSKVQIYSIVVGGTDGMDFIDDMNERFYVAKALSDQTGGVSLFSMAPFARSLSVRDSLSTLSQLLRSSYEINYSVHIDASSRKPAIIGVKTTRSAVELLVATEYAQQ